MVDGRGKRKKGKKVKTKKLNEKYKSKARSSLFSTHVVC